MIDIAWTELLFVLVIALIFIGPKELPALLRTLGRWAGAVRSWSHHFMDELDALEDEESPPPRHGP